MNRTGGLAGLKARAPATGVGSAEYWEDRCLQLTDENRNLKDINHKLEIKCKQLGVRLTKIHEDLRKKEALDMEGAGMAPVGRKRDIEVEDMIEEQRKQIRDLKRKNEDLTKRVGYYKQITEVKKGPSTGAAKKMFGAASAVTALGKGKGSMSTSPRSPDDGKLAEHQKMSQAMANMLQDRQAEIKRLQRENLELRKHIQSSGGHMGDVPTRDTDMGTDVVSMQLELDVKTDEIAKKDKHLENLSSQIKELTGETHELRKKLRAAESGESGASQRDGATTTEANALKKENNLLKEQCGLIKEQLDASKKAFNQLQSDILAGKTSADSKEDAMKRVNTEADINGLQKVVKEMERELRAVKDEKDRLHKNYTKVDAEYKELDRKFQDLRRITEESLGANQGHLLEKILEGGNDQIKNGRAAEKLRAERDQAIVDLKRAEDVHNQAMKKRDLELDLLKKKLQAGSNSGDPALADLQEDYNKLQATHDMLKTRYDELQQKHDMMRHPSSKGASGAILAGDMSPGDVTVSIEIANMELSPKARELLQDDSSVFVAFDFFEHDTRFTPVLSHKSDLDFNFTAQYIVHVDDFFCHYLLQEELSLDVYQTKGTEPQKFASLSMKLWGKAFSTRDGEQIHSPALFLDNGQEGGRLKFIVRVTPQGSLKSAIDRFMPRREAITKGGNARGGSGAVDVEIAITRVHLKDGSNSTRRVFATFKFFNFDEVLTEVTPIQSNRDIRPTSAWKPTRFNVPSSAAKSLQQYCETDSLVFLLIDEEDDEFDLLSHGFRIDTNRQNQDHSGVPLYDKNKRQAGEIDVRVTYKQKTK